MGFNFFVLSNLLLSVNTIVYAQYGKIGKSNKINRNPPREMSLGMWNQKT